MHSLEFPSKRYFGNRAETFVRVRRAQLEVEFFYGFMHVVFLFVRNKLLIKIAWTKEVKFYLADSAHVRIIKHFQMLFTKVSVE